MKQLLLAVLVIAGGCSSGGGNQVPDASLAKVWLRQEVALGSRRPDVISFLKGHTLDGRFSMQSDFKYHALPSMDYGCSAFRNRSGHEVECGFNGGRDGSFSYTSRRTIIVYVSTPKKDRSFVWCDLSMFIGFDQQDRVDSRKAAQTCTGP
ncbi:MAG TPA: hypothetical protein VID19_13215 [Candidatus Eremiobacteraceae bacterium]